MSRPVLGALGIVAATLVAVPARAATWVGGRTTPSLREVVAIDATGEPGWIYGTEDVAGDGLATFTPQEQAIDVRTAYAATDASRFWVRAYVSGETAIGADVVVFVFIDSDANAATGGTANAPEILPLLGAADPSPGGYEFVVGVRGNGTVEGIWQWRAAQTSYAALPANQGTRTAENGRDVDPIRVGADLHGYVQATITHSTIGFTAVCGTRLFFRSVYTGQGLGNGDLNVGSAGPCVPDANGDNVPDVLVPPSGCTSDAQCPERGVCVDGRCVLTPPCVTTADCPSGFACTADGRCVPVGGTSCTTNDTCNGLVCVSGTCAACTPGGSECGTDQRCGPDGRCVAGGSSTGGATGDGGISLAPGEKVVGGAFHCSTGARAGGGGAAIGALLAAAFGSLAARRRRRSGRDENDSQAARRR